MIPENIQKTLDYLTNHHVKYLDYTTYNLQDDDDPKYQEQYEYLFDYILVPKFFKALNLNITNLSLVFNFFDYENNQWYANFYEPELCVAIKDIFKDDNYLVPFKEQLNTKSDIYKVED